MDTDDWVVGWWWAGAGGWGEWVYPGSNWGEISAYKCE